MLGHTKVSMLPVNEFLIIFNCLIQWMFFLLMQNGSMLFFGYIIGLFPNYGHADPPPFPQKGSPQKNGYEWCGV